MSEQLGVSALGKAITIRRVELGLSRNDLRDRSGLSYPYVAELEKGTKTPSSRALEAIAEALELRPHELLARAEEMEGVFSTQPAPPPLAAGPESRRRWFAPASAPAPVVSRRQSAPTGGPLTEDRVRQIVREELRRLLAEAAGDPPGG